jgi:cell division protease FtsH
MEKKQQKFSIGYFVLALAIILALQVFLTARDVETLNYSQFKQLVRQGQVSDLVISETAIRGNIRPQGLKEILPEERLAALPEDVRTGQRPLGFNVVRIEDPELVGELEKAGIQFRGEVTSEWLSILLSGSQT